MINTEPTAEQLAQCEPSLDSMLHALEAFYSTDNVRDAMLAAYRIMLADALKVADVNLTVEG